MIDQFPDKYPTIYDYFHLAQIGIFRSNIYKIVFLFQAEDGIRDIGVTGVQTCALPILVTVTAAVPPNWVWICAAIDCTVEGASARPLVAPAERPTFPMPLLTAAALPWLVLATRPTFPRPVLPLTALTLTAEAAPLLAEVRVSALVPAAQPAVTRPLRADPEIAFWIAVRNAPAVL